MRDLKTEYDALKTERERAQFEKNVWNMRSLGPSPTGKKTRGIRDYVPQLLGVPAYGVEHRYFLSRFGSWVDPLWDKMEHDGMTLAAAVNIARRAKLLSLDSRIPFPETLKTELQNYGGDGSVKHIYGDRVVYTRRHASESAPSESPVIEGPFWDYLSQIIRKGLSVEAAGLSPTESRNILRNFETDISIAITDAKRRIAKAKKLGNSEESIVQSSVNDACQILKIPPPFPGYPVDMVEANRQRKKLARSYHPDSHGGSEHLRDRFHEVMQAYSIIEQYNDNLVPEQRKEANV